MTKMYSDENMLATLVRDNEEAAKDGETVLPFEFEFIDDIAHQIFCLNDEQFSESLCHQQAFRLITMQA